MMSTDRDFNGEIDQAALAASELLLANSAKLATVESCTGGWVAQSITAIAGSSEFFDRGWATYSNEAKMQCVGVRAGTIRDFGAVSEETAAAMAEGGVRKSDASVAVSITGVAGPTGGSAEKPVGTVCFGWANQKGDVVSERMQFDGDRNAVRAQSVLHALAGLTRVLSD